MNTAFSLTNGQPVKLSGRHGIIHFADQEVTLVKFGNGEYRHYPTHEMKVAINEQKLHLMAAPTHIRCVNSLTKKQQKEHDRRVAYCEEFARYANPCAEEFRELIIDTVYQQIKDTHPKKPAWKTAYAWYKQWLTDGKDMKPQIALRDDQGFRMPQELKDILDKIIKKHYLKLSRPSAAYAYRQLKAYFVKHARKLIDLKIPSLTTFRRYIKGMSKYEIDLARFGKKYAEVENRPALKVYKTTFPLERIECDAFEVNIGLLNEDGSYAGKVTIYLVMDVFTRAILGYAVQVGKTKESAAAVIHSIAHSIRIKANPKKHPMGGLGLCYVIDNGAGYRAEMTTKFLNSLGSDIVRCRTRRADEKPHVERAIGTMRNAFFKNLDGYLGKRKEVHITELTIKQAAKLSVSEFMIMFEDYIQNVYHHTPNSGLNNYTPFEMWKKHADESEVITLSDFDDRLKLRGNAKNLRCSINTGVKHRGQRFNSTELRNLIASVIKGTEVKSCLMEVLIDDFDASAITVLHDGKMIEVPNVGDVQRDQGFSYLNSKIKNVSDLDKPLPMSARQAMAQNRVRRINGTHIESDTLIQDPEITENTITQQEQDYATTSTITDEERANTDGFGIDDE